LKHLRPFGGEKGKRNGAKGCNGRARLRGGGLPRKVTGKVEGSSRTRRQRERERALKKVHVSWLESGQRKKFKRKTNIK